MNQEHDYVNYFYEKYEGRVAIGVDYDQNLSEIYPFVYEDIAGKSIGIVALGVYRWDSISYVHIYHTIILVLSRAAAKTATKYSRHCACRQTNTTLY